MSSRAVPEALLPWALSTLELNNRDLVAPLSVVAGDASNRRYFRLNVLNQSYVVVEAPPATEKNDAFLHIAALLEAASVKVPTVLGADLDQGFLLLEDLGDQVLFPALTPDSVGGHYRHAFEVLEKMAVVDTISSGLGPYDRELLGEELSRFQEWFVQKLIGYTLNEQEQALLGDLFEALIDSALEQPLVLVHRDFHSRNLMLTGTGQLAVIDFQDAVIGPITYDLASLLRDCYIQWPLEQVQQWAHSYREQLCSRGLLIDVDETRFQRWFDWMGLQRHIKVLGTFARLYLRDGKPGYLDDLPLVLHYVQEVVSQYADEEPAFAAFGEWFCQHLSPLIAAQSWSKSP